MKQARRWLLVAAALSVPTASFAQAKGNNTAAAEATVDLDADQSIELDGEQQAAETPETEEGGSDEGSICEIDPSACPKAADLKTLADRPIQAEVYAVQQAYVLRKNRFEINPYWGVTLNDQFVSHPGPGLALNYYVSNVLAIGVNGNYYGGLNVDSDFNFQNRRAARVANPLNEYLFNANLNFTYVPIYGKFAGFSKFIFHYDIYAVGGVGMMMSRPLPVIDPDNRDFQHKPSLSFNLGAGLRIFFTRWLAANLELRDYMYFERLESIAVDKSNPTNKDKWYGDSSFTNNVQAQLGLSVFLPFSWKYKLPK